MQGPRHDHEVGLAVEDIVNNLQAMELAMIYADPDVMAATTTRCLHHGRPDKYVPLSLDPACPRAGELVRCLGCITRDVRAELTHPALMRGTAEAKRTLKRRGLTSYPIELARTSMGWDGLATVKRCEAMFRCFFRRFFSPHISVPFQRLRPRVF